MAYTDVRNHDDALALVRLGPRLREEASRLTPDVLDGYRLVHDTLIDALADHEAPDAGRLSERLRRRAVRLD